MSVKYVLRYGLYVGACAGLVGCGSGAPSELGDVPSALLAQPCTFTAGAMTLNITAGETAYVSYRAADNMVVANAVQSNKAECAMSPTKVLTVNGSTGVDTLFLDLYSAPSTWPKATASFVPIVVDLKTGNDFFKVRGSTGVDTWTLGATGMNFQASPDAFADLKLTGVESVTVGLEAGNDVFTAAGSTATGAVFAGTLTVFGDDGDDKITGGVPTSGMNELWGGAGDDRFVQGAKGKDHIHGGTNTVVGDTVDYSLRTNAVVINLATATAISGEGSGATLEADTIETDIENAVGGSGDDVITGNASDNTLIGMAGNDAIYGAAGVDTIYGCNGDDLIQGGLGDDVLDGEGLLNCTVGAVVAGGTAGATGDLDTLDYTDRVSGEDVTVVITDGATTAGGVGSEADSVKNFVNVTGGGGNDTITGSLSPNILRGGAGDDTIVGGGGGDWIYGEAGDDTLTGAAGVDHIDGGLGLDIIDGVAGADSLIGGGGVADTFFCHAGENAVIIDYVVADVAGSMTVLTDCTTHF